ncbi:hypothetical protein [Catenuloplanes indicus]|uniref:Uncharacterized protein n=1 Tax=Catenuloplanes indicus TaxID=137267 RepID=A0AAE3VTW2_9ACTN|nr:hypothetical protein [Catenuloplanes indicus]MDQ0363579.1 hypothetical protein [Catenuloplanes indicus]
MNTTSLAPPRLLLHTPLLRRLVDGRVCELTFTGRTGMPVRYVSTGTEVLVNAREAARDPWWTAFRCPAPVHVWLAGERRYGHGRAVCHGQPGWEQARLVYQRRFPQPPVAGTDIFVVITLNHASSRRTNDGTDGDRRRDRRLGRRRPRGTLGRS